MDYQEISEVCVVIMVLFVRLIIVLLTRPRRTSLSKLFFNIVNRADAKLSRLRSSQLLNELT
jgi:hypothetical protein